MGRTRMPRGGGGRPLRSLRTLGFFFHMFFYGNMGEGAAIVTAMTANAPLFDPSFLNKGLIAFGTDKDPFDVMHLSLRFHPLPPSGGLRRHSAVNPATGDFSFATGKRMRGVAPARRGPFVSAKGPKTIGARARPFGCLCRSPSGQGCGTRFTQTVLAPRSEAGLRRSHARRRQDVAPSHGASFSWRPLQAA